MKIKTALAGLAGLVLAACTENIDLQEKVLMMGGNSLNIEVTDEFDAAATRADYSGFPSTTFETGDAIGIYAFDGSSYVTSNIRFVRQSDGSWTPDKEVPYVEGYTYYAYFPYRATVYTPSTSGDVDAVDTKFASFISDVSDYFWQADQSTKAGFTYSNLMIAKGKMTGEDDSNITVKFVMDHKRGLAVFNGEGVTCLTFTGNIPYTVNSAKHFLMKPETSTSIGNFTFSVEAGEYDSKNIPLPDFLKFTALEEGTFTLTIPTYVNAYRLASVSYSLDNGITWTKTNNSSSEVVITTPTVPAGGTVLWRGIGYAYGIESGNSRYSSTGRFEISGNIMSLLKEYNFETIIIPSTSSYCFNELFRNCSKLTKATIKLPDNNLTERCFGSMFMGCTNLTEGPELPATTLATSCYNGMFYNCRSLTTAPELPATTLAEACYNSMFYGCRSLTTAPELPATTLANYCYSNMFTNCTSLTTAPELPATTLEAYCYNFMFNGCSSLNYIKAAFTSINENSLNRWVEGVAASGTFYKNSDATWDVIGKNGVPSGWTIETYTP